MYSLLRSLSLLSLLAIASCGPVVIHDASFHPDYILRVTAQNYSQACMERSSVLVNGSSPGPELRLLEGQVTWIRVFNDMGDANLTMVNPGYPLQGKPVYVDLMTALARPHRVYGPVLGWDPSSQPMAHPSPPFLRLRNSARGRIRRNVFLPLPLRLSGCFRPRSSYCGIVHPSAIQV
jgi:hypothetical protein